METLVSKWYSIDQCKKNPTSLFIFGDNLTRQGMGGQAMIREQDNAIGISTKKSPGMTEGDFYTDSEYEENCKLIDEDIQRVKTYAEEKRYKNIVFPFAGLGTGLSAMQTVCCKTFYYLCNRLYDEFLFNNVASLKSK